MLFKLELINLIVNYNFFLEQEPLFIFKMLINEFKRKKKKKKNILKGTKNKNRKSEIWTLNSTAF